MGEDTSFLLALRLNAGTVGSVGPAPGGDIGFVYAVFKGVVSALDLHVAELFLGVPAYGF